MEKKPQHNHSLTNAVDNKINVNRLKKGRETKTNLGRWRWSHTRLINYGCIRKYTLAITIEFDVRFRFCEVCQVTVDDEDNQHKAVVRIIISIDQVALLTFPQV